MYFLQPNLRRERSLMIGIKDSYNFYQLIRSILLKKLGTSHNSTKRNASVSSSSSMA